MSKQFEITKQLKSSAEDEKKEEGRKVEQETKKESKQVLEGKSEVKVETGIEKKEVVGGEELKKIQKKIEEIKKDKQEKEEIEKTKEEEEKKLKIIKELVGESLSKEFKEMIGDNSEEVWKKRERLWQLPENRVDVLAALAGIASERSRKILNEAKESQFCWWGVSRGLIGDDSEEAWEIRNYLKFDEKVQRLRGERWASVLKRLGFHKAEWLYKLRSRIKIPPGFYLPGDVVISTTGLDSERDWQLREELEELAPAEVLISLAGNKSERAQQIREKYKRDKKLEWALRKSLIGVEKTKLK